MKRWLFLCLWSFFSLAVEAHRCLQVPWLTIRGQDARGSYSGAIDFWNAEFERDGFTRVVDYADDVKVFENRKLSWVFQGKITGDALLAKLQYRDFVTETAEQKRTLADPLYIELKAKIQFDENCRGQATFQLNDQTWVEEWMPGKAPYPLAPYLGVQRTRQPTMDSFSGWELKSIHQLFRTYHELPDVKPYASRADFQAGVDYAVTDKTDFDFYRAHPDRIRIRQKAIDSISLAEEKPRADAYGPTLRQKADWADRQVWEKFFNQESKTLGSSFRDGQGWSSSYDGVLWQGMYLAGQYFKYKETGDPQVLQRIQDLLEGILVHQEISDDPSTFARTLRPKTGDLSNPRWRAGTGQFSHLEWLTGGNNDMLKGLQIGMTYGYLAFCQPVDASPLCSRIRKNAQALADHVRVKVITDNTMFSTWLASWVTKNDPIASWKYALKTQAYWLATKPFVEKVSEKAVLYGQGDWSGLNLHLAARMIMSVLLKEHPLSENRHHLMETSFRRQVESLTKVSERMRYTNWLVAGSGWLKDSESRKEDAIWRMREIPVPKIRAFVDHRLNPEYCVSLIPSHPWKFDWQKENRTRDIRYKPFFEVASTDWILKDDSKSYYFDTRAVELSTADFSFIYWLARSFGISE